MMPGESFDFVKFEETLIEVAPEKISITGGEPTMNIPNLYRLIALINKHAPTAFLVMNTNGYNLNELDEDDVIKEFDSISISRHHHLDARNNEILGFQTLSKNDLRNLITNNKKGVFHFSCNLIKGY